MRKIMIGTALGNDSDRYGNNNDTRTDTLLINRPELPLGQLAPHR